jgi:sugar diacid utilization regulator
MAMVQGHLKNLSSLWQLTATLARPLLRSDRVYLILSTADGEAPLIIDDETLPEEGWIHPLPEGVSWLPRTEVIAPVAELQLHPHVRQSLDSASAQTVASAPLILPQGLVGWLAAGFCLKSSEAALNPGVLQLLAENAAQALLHSLQSEQTHQRYRALHEIGMQIQAEIELDKVLHLVTQRASELLRTEMAYIFLLEEETGYMVVTASIGLRGDLQHARLAPGLGLVGAAYQQGRPIVTPDYQLHFHSTDPYVRRLTIDEGTMGVAAVPMSWAGRTIGVLIVGNRHVTHFRSDEVELLTTLATQASIAVENARLYASQVRAQRELRQLTATLQEKVGQLERSMVRHRELTLAALSASGVGGVAETLSRLLERRVYAVQGKGRVQLVPGHATHAGPDEEECSAAALEAARQIAAGELEGEPPWYIKDLVTVPVAAGSEVLGCLCVQANEPLDIVETQALEHAATVMALELSRQKAAFEVEMRLRGDLLDDIVARRFESREQLTARAAHLGLTLIGPYRFVVFEFASAGADSPGGDALSAESRARAFRVITAGLEQHTTLAAWRNGRVITLLPASEGERHRLTDKARSIQEHLRAGRPSLRATAGIGSRVSRLDDLAQSYREALACVQLARAMGTPEAVLDYGELGLFRLFMDLPDRTRPVELVRQELGALQAYDRRHASDLLATLRAYVEEDGNLKNASERSHIHVNSLKYRLERITQLLKTDVRVAERRFCLRLAFQMWDFLTALSIDPWAEKGLVDL